MKILFGNSIWKMIFQFFSCIPSHIHHSHLWPVQINKCNCYFSGHEKLHHIVALLFSVNYTTLGSDRLKRYFTKLAWAIASLHHFSLSHGTKRWLHRQQICRLAATTDGKDQTPVLLSWVTLAGVTGPLIEASVLFWVEEVEALTR